MPTPEGQKSEDRKARIRAITADARAEGRDYTAAERAALLGCVGEDVTGRVAFRREGREAVALLDGREVGAVELPTA